MPRQTNETSPGNVGLVEEEGNEEAEELKDLEDFFSRRLEEVRGVIN